jgi:hypothetical protein
MIAMTIPEDIELGITAANALAWLKITTEPIPGLIAPTGDMSGGIQRTTITLAETQLVELPEGPLDVLRHHLMRI